ncbi:MAG: S41 family peptidase [candidate division Zixibacteria bacterium]|nr:S41 family peptidase [candidate division Zixibacteria bacterium]
MNHLRYILLVSVLVLMLLSTVQSQTQGRPGYLRYPAIHGDALVFVAEGDLWLASAAGGDAQRLTTHPDLEYRPAISPDGRLLAFSGRYEGPTEVYVMPIAGGLPRRLTFNGEGSYVVGWTPDGKVLFATRAFSTLPELELAAVDPENSEIVRLPLAQAAEGTYAPDGRTLFFTRFPFSGSYTKRYRGGMAQSIWRFASDDTEASEVTADFDGTSRNPMYFDGRVYFLSDRDGVMNVWSMTEAGEDLQQHTFHADFDAKYASLSHGRIAYQLGADLHVLDIATGSDTKLDIHLTSDFDQLREQWVDKPMDYVTSSSVSPTGDRVAFTARGQVFVAPVNKGRLVRVTHNDAVRYRDARFMPDGESVLVLSDESGEVEFWSLPAYGTGDARQMTTGGEVLRFEGYPSPDGKYVAHTDKNNRLWFFDIESGRHTVIDSSPRWSPSSPTWSPDSRWIGYSRESGAMLWQARIYDRITGSNIAVTSDRYDDGSPVFSPDGKWIFLLSNRHENSLVSHPWESRQPFPFLDKQTRIYMIPLKDGLLSPFEPTNELTARQKADSAADSTEVVEVDSVGIVERLLDVPVPPGNYGSLSVNEKQLFWLSWESGGESSRSLKTIEIKNDDPEVKTLMEGVSTYELSADGKKLMIRKGDNTYVIDAGTAPPSDLAKYKVAVADWTFAFDPAQEWRQMFMDAWRLERDYFYDKSMHGVDWPKVRDKYLPLVERVTDRWELSDLLGEMIGELSSLHMYVYGGDMREGTDNISVASLGAILIRDESAGGYRVDYVYRSDPDEPSGVAPLARPSVNVSPGDVITHINGVATLSVPGHELLLREQAGKQVLLTVRPRGSDDPRSVIVEPLSLSSAGDLRYRDWEFTRRLRVEEKSDRQIGYVHLRAMGKGDYSRWARDFYPVIERQGLIIDARHNHGGNIDSWILTTLLRHPWLYWVGRVGEPYPNMQSSFAGHIVVLCDQQTVSDGEMFTEGIRRLGLGTIIGTRTLGGEIWLSSSNVLVDRGIATAAESGVYGPEGEWMIEGVGVVPDIEVDNLPHATFRGSDAQLDSAITFLMKKIADEPVVVPSPPRYPDKSFRNNRR